MGATKPRGSEQREYAGWVAGWVVVDVFATQEGRLRPWKLWRW
jgi:hypothetical protein